MLVSFFSPHFYLLHSHYLQHKLHKALHLQSTIYNNSRIYNYLSPLDYQHDNLTIHLLTRYLQYNVITGVTYNKTIKSFSLGNNLLTY